MEMQEAPHDPIICGINETVGDITLLVLLWVMMTNLVAWNIEIYSLTTLDVESLKGIISG